MLVHRLIAALVLAGALLGCAAPADLTWTIDFAAPTLRARAAVVRASITRDGCAGEEVYSVLVRPGDRTGPLPPALARGRWGFHAIATDADCVRFAETCDAVELPMVSAVRSLLVPSVTEIAECAATECDDGTCASSDAGGHDGGSDGSIVDASGDAAIADDAGIDGASPDAASDDGGSDAASTDAGPVDAGPVDAGPSDTGVADPCASSLMTAGSRAGCNGGFATGTPGADEPAGTCDVFGDGTNSCIMASLCTRAASPGRHCFPFCTPSAPTDVSTGTCMAGFRCFEVTGSTAHVCARDCNSSHPCPGGLLCGSGGGCY